MHAGDIFELLRDGRPWTRAELADATGLARSTIAARIDVLMRLEPSVDLMRPRYVRPAS